MILGLGLVRGGVRQGVYSRMERDWGRRLKKTVTTTCHKPLTPSQKEVSGLNHNFHVKCHHIDEYAIDV